MKYHERIVLAAVSVVIGAIPQATRSGGGALYDIDHTTFPASAGVATGGNFEIAGQ